MTNCISFIKPLFVSFAHSKNWFVSFSSWLVNIHSSEQSFLSVGYTYWKCLLPVGLAFSRVQCCLSINRGSRLYWCPICQSLSLWLRRLASRSQGLEDVPYGILYNFCSFAFYTLIYNSPGIGFCVWCDIGVQRRWPQIVYVPSLRILLVL